MRFRTRSHEDVEITVIPLIDVLLFLLLFFILTTTFDHQQGLKINLPQASDQTATEQPRMLEIAIDAQGLYYVGGRKVVNTNEDTLRAALKAALKPHQNIPVVIRADGQTPHQAVITAMDIAQQLGVRRLSMATQVQDADP